MSSLERAIAIACKAHRGKKDKAGELYILHVMRVVLGVESPQARIVAALHDVVEDSEKWTLERLAAESFPPDIIEAVDALTHRKGESYEDFVERCAHLPLAREVKLADLRDNLRQLRMMPSSPGNEHREVEYRSALARLGQPAD
jgi:(p)ppGpp synthase/HD superfamily hydrolase